MAKLRIYDLVHACTLNEADQKVRKQKQQELTKQIIVACEGLGIPVKSGHGSIEEDFKDKVINKLLEEKLIDDTDTINKELRKHIEEKAEKKTKSTKASTKETVQQAESQPPKKQLKIVRRIKPAPQVIEEKQVETSIQTTPPTPPLQVQQKEEPPPAPKIKIIKPETRKLTQPLPSSIQPFRVAKPTVAPSMMGRTKRPSHRGSTQQKEKKEEEVITIDRPSSVVLTSAMTVQELANKLSLPETEVVKNLFSRGVIKTVNQTIELETVVECAKSLGYEVITKEEEKEEKSLQPDISTEAEKDLLPRPPVVTIMGHVDHGKTTLLDAIRETKLKITEQEAGGITQHIGAYQVEILDYDGKKKKITFLDTPGHEAFTAMRARGAQVTDIAILVVAADDGVMPQTIEAIDHAKAAGVPIIIALNKIDKEGAVPDKVLGQLTEHDLLIEDYGGKTVCSRISAKKRMNLDDLLTKITLVADAELSQKLRANPNRLSTGVVIEAQLSKERGPIAHLLVHNGTLKKGDALVAGKIAGRVRAMFDDHGREVTSAPPSMPIEIIGLPNIPNAGDTFEVHESYQKAKEIALQKQAEVQESRKSIGLVDFASKVREGQVHELKIIIKADVHGSAEAVAKEVINLSTKDVLVRLIHIGTGNITESDINLASSTNAIVIGFHVDVDANTQKIAIEQGVDLRLYDIIYKITEDLKNAVLGLLEPIKEEVKMGTAEVRKVFEYGKGNKIAGSYVKEGKIQRNQLAKVIRGGQLIYDGKITGLKRFKDDAREVQSGFECGVSFEQFQDLEEGDVIECWTIVEKERTSI